MNKALNENEQKRSEKVNHTDDFKSDTDLKQTEITENILVIEKHSEQFESSDSNEDNKDITNERKIPIVFKENLGKYLCINYSEENQRILAKV